MYRSVGLHRGRCRRGQRLRSPGAFAETWDGTRWRLQPVPTPAGAAPAELFGVSCPVPGSCTAVGDTAGQSNIGVTLAMTTARR